MDRFMGNPKFAGEESPRKTFGVQGMQGSETGHGRECKFLSGLPWSA